MLHEFLDILAAMVKLPYYSSYYKKMNKLRENSRIFTPLVFWFSKETSCIPIPNIARQYHERYITFKPF
jgi:hypothetical protein